MLRRGSCSSSLSFSCRAPPQRCGLVVARPVVVMRSAPIRRYAKSAGPLPDFLKDMPDEGDEEEEMKKKAAAAAAKRKKREALKVKRAEKPKSAGRLAKEAQSNLRYRTLEIAPGEETQFNMVASTMLYRKPIIFPELTRWEQAWYTLKEKRRLEETRRVFPFKKKPEEPPNIPRNVKPGDRITAADRANDRHTTDRRLAEYIFLLVKKDRAEHAWQFPRIIVPPGELKLRHVTQEAMKKLVPEGPFVWYDTNAPCAHMFYRYGTPHATGKVGAMEFFYRAELIKGTIKELQQTPGIVDFAWVAADELPHYISLELYRAVADAMPPLLVSREDPTFNLTPPPERKPTKKGSSSSSSSSSAASSSSTTTTAAATTTAAPSTPSSPPSPPSSPSSEAPSAASPK